jgi:hypothetical protein
MSQPTTQVDLDAERVLLDGQWWSAAELSSTMRARIEAGDFRVAPLATALERLEDALSKTVAVSVRVPPELHETFTRIAEVEAVPVTSVLRRALVLYLASEEATSRLIDAKDT